MWYINKTFSNKKEQNTHTCYAEDEPQKHYAKWKKSDAKDYM